MRLGTKSDLLSKCLEPLTTTTGDVPEVDVLVIDGAAIVNMLKPSTSRTFDDYADLIFCPYIRKHLETVARVDVVWDAYIENSLKAATRSKRGKRIRRRVKSKNKIPQNWQSFLRDDDNKKELLSFLSQQLAQQNFAEKVVVATNALDALCYPPHDDVSSLAPCSHEEADTRIMVHGLMQ
ncbi:unnamed protein product [Mytilus coruscus]|uniref:Uncharacterized protein n=1 Tax=Mytilus coruscus TaxID=42192 RepID=A0A6J8AN93_MYTCO|nr:unnamed protein product [Mytilus coruscus]